MVSPYIPARCLSYVDPNPRFNEKRPAIDTRGRRSADRPKKNGRAAPTGRRTAEGHVRGNRLPPRLLEGLELRLHALELLLEFLDLGAKVVGLGTLKDDARHCRPPLDRLASGPEVSRYLAATENLLQRVEEGNTRKLAEEARRTPIPEKVEQLRRSMRLEVPPPAVRPVRMPKQTPKEVERLFHGHVALRSGDYMKAIKDLSAGVDAAPRTASLLLADAYLKSGEFGKALERYAAVTFDVSAGAGAEATSCWYVARGIARAAQDHSIYVNQTPARQAGQEGIFQALAAKEWTLSCRAAPTATTWYVVAPENSTAIRTLERLKVRGNFVQMRASGGVATAQVNVKELAASLEAPELEKLRRVETIGLLLESAKPPESDQRRDF